MISERRWLLRLDSFDNEALGSTLFLILNLTHVAQNFLQLAFELLNSTIKLIHVSPACLFREQTQSWASWAAREAQLSFKVREPWKTM